MPNLYARQTALTNVGGRIDYISNPERQENLLAVHDGADAAYWQQLARECKLASKHSSPGTKCVQGRELMIQLSNSLLQRLDGDTIAKILAQSFEEKYGRPCIVALHFNKKKNNLHAHLIYSERELLPEANEKIAPRALFFDEHGKRQYKKSAVLDEDGELRAGCRIIEKGEVYERRLFGAVDPKFSSKAWLKEAKREWLLPLRNGELLGDVEITEYNPETGELPQQHIGNNVEHGSPETAARIEAYNQDVKRFNELVRDGVIMKEVAHNVQEQEKHVKRNKGKGLRGFINQILEWYRKRRGIEAPEEKKKESLDNQLSGAEARTGSGSTPERQDLER